MALTVQTRVLNALGYSMTYIRNNPYLFPTTTTADELEYFDKLCTQVETIDTELLDNTKDSMAVKVQDLGLDYNRYISQTLSLRQRILERLSEVSGVVQFYGNGSGNVTVKNYY